MTAGSSSEKSLYLLFNQCPEAIAVIDPFFNVCFANTIFTGMLKTTAAALENQSFLALLSTIDQGGFKKLIKQQKFSSGNEKVSFFTELVTGEKEDLPVELTVSETTFTGNTRYIVFARKGLENHILSREIDLLHTLTHEVVASASYRAALETTLKSVCRFLKWDYGETWNVAAGHLTYETGWHLPDSALSEFAQKSRQKKLPFDSGLPFRVMQGEMVWSNQPAEPSSGMPRFEWAGEAGIKTAVFVPVLHDNKVIAYMAFFSLSSKAKTHATVSMLDSAARLLSALLHRKKLEEELKERELFIKHVADLSPSIISVRDIISDRNIYSNRGFFSVLGYSAAEIQSMGANVYLELVHQEDHAKYIERNRKIETLADNETIELEIRIKTRKGHWKWINTRTVIFRRTADGRPWLTLSSAIDLTAQVEGKLALAKSRKKLEQLNSSLEKKVQERTTALRELTEKLIAQERMVSQIANSIPAFISYIDNDLTYRFANHFYQNLYTSSSGVVGKSVESVVGSDYFARNKSKFYKALKGEAVSFESKVTFKDGEKIIDVKYIPDIDSEGNTRGIVVLGVEITERITFENRLRAQNAKLHRINSDLDNFIYIASHDLKSPVTNIRGLISLLDNKLAQRGVLTTDLQEVLKMMTVSTQKFHKVITDLNDINSVHRHNKNDVQEVNLKKMLASIKTDLATMIAQSKAWIEEQVDDCPPIYYSSSRLRMVIYHLISNAIQYRDPHRRLSVKINCEERPGHYCIEVSDNGIGIDEQNREKIFHMFRRYNNRAGGSGVGLYIVKRILEDDGGKIEVESQLNKGSVFKVYLPKTLSLKTLKQFPI